MSILNLSRPKSLYTRNVSTFVHVYPTFYLCVQKTVSHLSYLHDMTCISIKQGLSYVVEKLSYSE